MADLRSRLPVKIADATTPSQQATVTAGGSVQVINAANDGVDIGNVDVASVIPLTGATNLGKAVDAVVGATDTGVAALAERDDALGGITPAEGDYARLLVDANGALWTRVNAGPTGTSALQQQGTAADGAAAVGNPVHVGGKDGSGNIQSVTTDTDGHLQVDVLTGGGSDTPTNPTINVASSSGTAAGSSANLDSAEITEAEKLWEVHVSASVPFKTQIQAVEDGVARNVSNLMFGQAGQTVIWRTPHRNFVTHAGAAAGLDVFRAVTTNMDGSEAADLHAAFYYST